LIARFAEGVGRATPRKEQGDAGDEQYADKNGGHGTAGPLFGLGRELQLFDLLRVHSTDTNMPEYGLREKEEVAITLI
jgi:hypothetical protein